MAGRKEHEVLFVLNAALNGNFKGAFSSAQTEFVKLGREIQDLHKLQGNISSYQKQEQAIASTTQKLSNLQQQHDLLQKEINETNGSTASLEREKLKLEQRIRGTEEALERQKQKLDATGQKLQAAGVDTANLAQADARLTEQIKELQAQQDKAADSASSFGERAAQGFGAIQSAIITAGIKEKLNEIKDAYAECVTVAANFQESMSNVEALSGSTAQEMAELNATAKELGANTKYTAQQAADAMGYMGMAGWKAEEMMAGMDGVINLAAASSEDLARVSDIVTDNLTAFGLTAADTAHFSDVLAAAATNSNTSVSIMGETFKQSASIAGALGYSIEDVAVGVGLMANAGVKGSIAGTALKNTFNGLLEGATLTAAAFGEYEFSAIKADGTMKGFAGTIDELRVYFDQMTEAERVNNAMAIAGQRGYNGLLAILNATDAGYQSLTDSINNCTGAAKRMADIKMDNLNGQLTLMNSAWEAVQTTIGEQFNPELRRLAEIGTEVLGWVNSFIQEHPAFVKGLTAAVAAIGAGVAALTGVAAVTKVLIPLMGALTAATPGVNIIVGVTAAVAGIAAAVTGLTTALDSGVPSVKELTGAAAEMRETMETSAATYDETASSVLAAANVADTYISKLEEMGDYAKLSEEEQRQYHNTLVLLTQVVPDLADSIDLENNAIEGGTAALRANTEAWKQNAMAQAYQDQLTAMYAAQAEVLIEAEENSIGLTRAQYELDAATKKYSETAARMNVLYAEAEAAAASYNEEHTFGKNAVSFLTQEYYDLEDALSDIGREMVVAEEAVGNYSEAIAEGNDAVAAAEEEIALAEEAVRNLTGAVEEQSAALPELSNALDPVQERLMNLADTYDNAYQSAYDSIDGQLGLFDEMKVKVDTSVSDMISSLESQVSYMATYSENLRQAADLGLSEGLLAQLSDGSTQSAAYLQAIVNSGETKIEELNAAFAKVQEGKEDFSGTVEEIQVGLDDAMAEMEQAVRDGVDAMELPDEAAQSARETIQAFIDQAEKMQPWVRDAYAQLGNAAANALGLDLRNASRGHSGDAGDHLAAYASGTSNAPPGWAWVGEKGPELIRMRGGETVLPTDVSRQFTILTAYQDKIAAYAGGTDNASAAAAEAVSLMEISNTAYAAYNNAAYSTSRENASYSYHASTMEAAPAAVEAIVSPGGGVSSPINVEIHIHIEGNATPETVQALEDYVSRGELQAAVREAMEESQADSRRRDGF